MSALTLDHLEVEACEEAYKLALVSSAAQEEGGRWAFEGSVRNLSNQPLSDLLVVVTLYGPDKRAQASFDAPLEMGVLPPGETATWRVVTARTEGLCMYDVQFRQWHLGVVPTRDDRPPVRDR